MTSALLFLLLSLNRVVDGDTVTIHGQRVRLYGVDAPEYDQPGGSEATAFLRTIVGREIDTMEVIDRDQYGRWVAVIHTPQGVNVNLELIRTGHARFYPRYCHKQPVCSEMKAAEREAREALRGLWAGDNSRPSPATGAPLGLIAAAAIGVLLIPGLYAAARRLAGGLSGGKPTRRKSR